MDDSKEGIILVGTSMIVLTIFLAAVVALMIIYRRRRLEYLRKITAMGEKFANELLRTQIEVQKQTMQNIGREIHDNIGQKLTLAVLYVQQLNLDNKITDSKIASIASIINESLSDLRGLSKNLTEADFINNDLCALIRNECSKVQATGFCKVLFNSDATVVEASEAIKSFTLRIIQEFLQNSLKHANCTVINIRMKRDDDRIEINASDDGRGFLIDELPLYGKGIGLSNMRRRAEIIHADFEMKSIPGEGTKMNLSIPLTKLNN